jgi:hypothetical protein
MIKANCSTKRICEHTSLKNKSNAYKNWNTKKKKKHSNFKIQRIKFRLKNLQRLQSSL